MFLPIYQTALRHFPEVRNLDTHYREYLESRINTLNYFNENQVLTQNVSDERAFP
jgi:hypothetical protein